MKILQKSQKKYTRGYKKSNTCQSRGNGRTLRKNRSVRVYDERITVRRACIDDRVWSSLILIK